MDRRQDPAEFRLFFVGSVHTVSQDFAWITSLRLHTLRTWEVAWLAGRYDNECAYTWTWCWLFQLYLCAYPRNVFQKGMRNVVLHMRRCKQFWRMWKRKQNCEKLKAAIHMFHIYGDVPKKSGRVCAFFSVSKMLEKKLWKRVSITKQGKN
jgi:hypothetical protein